MLLADLTLNLFLKPWLWFLSCFETLLWSWKVFLHSSLLQHSGLYKPSRRRVPALRLRVRSQLRVSRRQCGPEPRGQRHRSALPQRQTAHPPLALRPRPQILKPRPFLQRHHASLTHEHVLSHKEVHEALRPDRRRRRRRGGPRAAARGFEHEAPPTESADPRAQAQDEAVGGKTKWRRCW